MHSIVTIQVLVDIHAHACTGGYVGQSIKLLAFL